ncbi:TetR/AcrR family transcriptional regulator [Demequina soli]|uniref:TetR/AcrR family transcriptional regulator n=1 Tax=Demequina soli TaxID=1638987 RepID=UPI000AD99D71|nr:TetR/AcrR family transcriptional regulator C-terminal domain-containing protein [Demequina soli]
MTDESREIAKQEMKRLREEMRADVSRMRDEMRQEWFEAAAERGLGPRGPRGGARGGHQGRSAQPGRARRGGRQALSREAIVESAAKIMDKDGLAAVTMRKVAWDLDTGPASLYVHVRNVAELHGLLLDRQLGELDLEAGEGGWQDRVIAVIEGFVGLLFAHPDLARSALTARPQGPHTLALVERLLALLAEGGVPVGQRAWGVDILLLWATATAAEHADQEAESAPDSATSQALIAAMTGTGYPQIREVGLDLIAGSVEERSAWALRVLLNGIAATGRA